jgi:hypothetical protein
MPLNKAWDTEGGGDITLKFSQDLKFGKENEAKIVDMLENSSIEVKTERDMWANTGNIAIEIARGNLSNPTGLTLSKSDVWIQALSFKGEIVGFLCFSTQRLLSFVRWLYRAKKVKAIPMGDGLKTFGVLIPLSKLFDWYVTFLDLEK